MVKITKSIGILFFLSIILTFYACQSQVVYISDDLSPAELIQRAQEAADRNRYNTAAQYYEALYERNRDNIDLVITAEYHIAFIHYKQKNYQLAREEFNSLLNYYESPDAVLLPQHFKILTNIVLQRIDEAESAKPSLFSGRNNTSQNEIPSIVSTDYQNEASVVSGSSQLITPVPSYESAQNDPNRRADPDAANWDIAFLDTAANADYLTGIEKDVILEMNKARTDPKKYVELYIQPMLIYYSGNIYFTPDQIIMVTQEGTAAVNDCIADLNGADSVGILTPEHGLSLAAKDHVTDQSKTGETGHDGSDGSTSEIRMNRYGVFNGSWTLGENIAYGPATGRAIVCGLLIDDGVPDRGHRTNIMSGDYTQTGAAYGTHPQFTTSCVITYGNGYSSNR